VKADDHAMIQMDDLIVPNTDEHLSISLD